MNTRTERVKREIRAIYGPNAEKPANIAREQTSLYICACKLFGSWRNALEVCGVDYESSRNYKKWTRDRIVKEIMRLLSEGGSLRPTVLRKMVIPPSSPLPCITSVLGGGRSKHAESIIPPGERRRPITSYRVCSHLFSAPSVIPG